MKTFHRRLRATAGISGALALSCATGSRSIEDQVAKLVRTSEESNAALMRGDTDHYRSLVTLAGDFTLMSPFGGKPSRGASDEAIQRMRSFFKNGSHSQEVVSAYGSRDMIVLAIIERSRVEVGGLPRQDWALRVTLVYRRQGTEWRLVHRHADPLVDGITLPEAAALARGDRTKAKGG